MAASKSGKIVLVIMMAILVLVTTFTVYSVRNLGVVNPILSGWGLARVALTDTSYACVQSEPMVYVARADSAERSLIQAMKELGYQCNPDLRSGNLWVFEGEKGREVIHFSVGGHFASWQAV